MVALAIGMLGVLVMLQMFALSEERNRAASSGGDAQSNGILTYHQLQSNIVRAGYGMNSVGLFNCKATWQVASGNYLGKAIRLAPVTVNPVDAAGAAIIPVGDPNTDTLLIMYGNADGEPEGNKAETAASPTYAVQMPSSFTVGDRVIAAPATCAADLIVDRISAVATTSVTVAAGATGTSLFNLGRGPNGLPNAGGTNGPVVLAYAIRGGNLTVCDYVINDCSIAANTGNASVWEQLASNVVSLRAQYGRDTTATMDGVVDAYDQATPATACGWARVSAIRLALVTRSAQFEKTAGTSTTPVYVTTAAPMWAGSTIDNPVGSSVAAIDLTKKPDGTSNPDWKNYRYKLFQTVMPIRNVAWMGVPTGC